MTYTAIMDWEQDGVVAKILGFPSQGEAEAHVAAFSDRFPNAFVVPTPTFPEDQWRVQDGVVIDAGPEAPSADQVDAESLRRARSGFMFNGVHFQFDALAKGRIAGAASAAHIALTIGGKLPGDLKWHQIADEPVDDFSWIASDNTLVTMDAPTVIAFGQTAARHESAHVFAARALKAMNPIPADYATNETYWP